MHVCACVCVASVCCLPRVSVGRRVDQPTQHHSPANPPTQRQYEKDGTEFDSTEYMAETPHWALKGAIEEGFDPAVRESKQRVFVHAWEWIG